MRFSTHPFWLVGFRPFFALAAIAGATLPLLWALMFTGAVAPAPSFPVPPLQWHAHEMFFGFGWAVLGGFLLTSTKNWVGIRGYHGGTLVFLAAAWLFERIGMAFGGAWPAALLAASQFLFLAAIVVLLLRTLIQHREKDNYRDNFYFLLALPLFLPAKWLLLSPDHFAAGWGMVLALFRLAFLLMLERTLTQFMKGMFQVVLPRIAPLDHGIKGLALLLAFGHLLPRPLAAAAALLLALLLLARWLLWQPQRALPRLGIGIMYLGYLAIIAQLLLEAYGQVREAHWVGSLTAHVFTVGAMGLIVPAMLIRITKGHTGRKVAFDALDKTVLWLMLGGFVARVVAPQLLPGAYPMWMHLTATCWLAGFGLIAGRTIPWLLQPRVDGKEH
ncbi:MAG: NnrS family protein [Gammaproteobacteria bacterium]|nr:NnrS family protein [Gammaproteobacteria bacterium]MBU1646430.1 NnrS family protein [Gammaproteobacteria bacterium]MBU1970973.1 NnrS family protein [Gammaproteobacteria bacterium]